MELSLIHLWCEKVSSQQHCSSLQENGSIIQEFLNDFSKILVLVLRVKGLEKNCSVISNSIIKFAREIENNFCLRWALFFGTYLLSKFYLHHWICLVVNLHFVTQMAIFGPITLLTVRRKIGPNSKILSLSLNSHKMALKFEFLFFILLIFREFAFPGPIWI